MISCVGSLAAIGSLLKGRHVEGLPCFRWSFEPKCLNFVVRGGRGGLACYPGLLMWCTLESCLVVLDWSVVELQASEGQTNRPNLCCLIVDNMCKLVKDPAEALPLRSRLEPLVKSATEKIADPAARGVAGKACKSLQMAAGDGNAAENKRLEAQDALAIFKTALGDKANGEEFDTVGLHFAGLAAAATNIRQLDAATWMSELGLGPFVSVTKDIRVKIEVASKPAEEIAEEDTEGVDLYKGSFSFAYGMLTLLRDMKIHLKRNRFYGRAEVDHISSCSDRSTCDNGEVHHFCFCLGQSSHLWWSKEEIEEHTQLQGVSQEEIKEHTQQQGSLRRNIKHSQQQGKSRPCVPCLTTGRDLFVLVARHHLHRPSRR